MTPPPDEPDIDAQAVRDWRAQGLSLAEIGHRLGVSAQRLSELMAEQGVDPGDGRLDDHRPNSAEVR